MTVVYVETLEDCAEFATWLGQRRSTLAIDTETTGLEWWKDTIRLGIFSDTERAYVIPWDRWSGVIFEKLPHYTGSLTFHNAKFDLHFLRQAGLELPLHLVNDTLVMAHLVNPEGRHGLKHLASTHLDARAATAEKSLHDGMKKHGWTWATVPYDFVPYVGYAGLDGIFTARLAEHYGPTVRTTYRKAYDVEMAVLGIVGAMEARGFRVDAAYAAEKETELREYAQAVRRWARDAYEVNLGSQKQVVEALQADGVKLTKLTAGGAYSLDSEVLEVLDALDHPLAEAKKNAAAAEKLAGSYFHNITTRLDGDRVHCDVQTLGARTARMSIRNPSLQNQPRGTLVRDAFIPSSGNVLISSDYDQVEMRLLAHFAGEEGMIRAIREGMDLHSYSARELYGPDFTKDHRQGCKVWNFGTIYGAGDATRARQMGIPLGAARDFGQRYDETFPGVRTFMREVERVARARFSAEGAAYVTTPLGRRHPLDMNALYKGVNYLIQGTAADLLKEALVRLDSAGFGEFMLLPVHDEVIFDVPAGEADAMAKEIGDVMSDLTTYAVPITASAEVMAERWGDKYR